MSFVAVAIGGSAVLGLGGALIGANAAGNAASAQAGSANYAATLQKQAADAALAQQQSQFNTTQKNLAPFLQSGTTALGNLDFLLGLPGNYNTSGNPQAFNPQAPSTTGAIPPDAVFQPNQNRPLQGPGGRGLMMDSAPTTLTADGNGGYQPATTNTAQLGPQGAPGTQVNPELGKFGSLLTPWTEQFKAPDGITEQNDPGYQARLKLGTDAIEKSAAARGGVLTGGTAKDLTNYSQDYGSNEYGNVYSRAWNDYANRYNTFQTNNTNTYNRLAAAAGIGQQTANTLGMLGQNNSSNISSILTNSAGQIGQQANNAGAAMASGYVGSANAINQGIGGVSNALQNYMFLKNMGGGGTVSPYGMAGFAPQPTNVDFGAGTIPG